MGSPRVKSPKKTHKEVETEGAGLLCSMSDLLQKECRGDGTQDPPGQLG